MIEKAASTPLRPLWEERTARPPCCHRPSRTGCMQGSWMALCRRVVRRMSRQGSGRSPSIGLTHLNAARPREKVKSDPHCWSRKVCRISFHTHVQHVVVCPVRRTRTPFVGLFTYHDPSYGRDELGPYLASRRTLATACKAFREPRAPDSTGESKTLRTPRAFYRTRSAFRGAR